MSLLGLAKALVLAQKLLPEVFEVVVREGYVTPLGHLPFGESSVGSIPVSQFPCSLYRDCLITTISRTAVRHLTRGWGTCKRLSLCSFALHPRDAPLLLLQDNWT